MENLTKQQATDLFLEIMQQNQIQVKASDLKDFDFIDGGQTEAQVIEWANDWLSEEHSNRCEAKNAWRYEQ